MQKQNVQFLTGRDHKWIETKGHPTNTHSGNRFKDAIRSWARFFSAGIRLRLSSQFIHNFKLEPKEDGLSASGGGYRTDGRTVIDLPS